MDSSSVTPDSFKWLNQLLVTSFRLGLGPVFTGSLGDIGHILVLTTTECESGRPRRTPAHYAIVRGDVYCAASLGDWYSDVTANPAVEVWIGNQRWAGQAQPVADPHEWLPAYRQVLINSGFAKAWESLDPLTAPDEALLKRGAGLAVLRIRLEQEIHGPGGPGSLIWVWPAVAAGMALLAALRWRRRRD